MTFDGAVIREQGVTFALVVVKSHVVQNRFEATRAISEFQPYFPGLHSGTVLPLSSSSGKTAGAPQPTLGDGILLVSWQTFL